MGVRYYARIGKRSGISMPWWIGLIWLLILAVVAVYAVAFALIVGAIILAFYLLTHVPVWIVNRRQARKTTDATREAITLFASCTAQLQAGERPTPEERKEIEGLADSVILNWRPGEPVGTPLRDAAFRFTHALKESDARAGSATPTT